MNKLVSGCSGVLAMMFPPVHISPNYTGIVNFHPEIQLFPVILYSCTTTRQKSPKPEACRRNVETVRDLLRVLSLRAAKRRVSQIHVF